MYREGYMVNRESVLKKKEQKEDKDKLNQVKETFKKGIIEAYYMGFDKQELIAFIKNIVDELEGFGQQ